MSDTVEQVKSRLDIVDALRQYIAVIPAGRNFKALCPFHKEKTPSFVISPEKQVWHCFGCNAGGDLITFVMRYENLEFIEALKVLAEKAGIDMKISGGRDERQYQVLYDINRAAKEFYRKQLTVETASGAKALEYFKNRGLKEETIGEFELGFAPNTSDALTRYLLKTGFKIDEIERAGLASKTERGTYWDRFRNRLMFPLWNTFGKEIAFTGRLMPDAADTSVGKYVNSPETPVFSKSRLLYGFHKAKTAIRDSRLAVLVEGQMDLIMVWQDGVQNAIATSGTALTVEHLVQLKRLADTVVVAYDNDEAGQAASERVIDLAGGRDFFVKVIRHDTVKNEPALKDAKDPADIALSSPGFFAKLIAEAEPAMRYYFTRHLPARGREVNIIDLKRAIRTVLSKIKALASPIEQAHWVSELSKKTSVPESHLFEELNALKLTGVPVRGEETASQASPLDRNFTRQELISQKLLGFAAANPECRTKVEEHISFLPESYQKIAAALFGGATSALEPELSELASLISLRSALERSGGASEPEFKDLLRYLKTEHYRKMRDGLGLKIREAEASGDAEALASSLKEFDRLSKEIYNI